MTSLKIDPGSGYHRTDSDVKDSEVTLRSDLGKDSDIAKMVQQKPRVASFHVGWVQVIEELSWKLSSVSCKQVFLCAFVINTCDEDELPTLDH